jgi:hypothetical protein
LVIGCLALLVSLVVGQEPSTVQRGTWTATAGPSAKQVMRGSWSAETLSGTPNVARGSWTLVNAGSEVVLQGTWSAARSSSAGWHGTWSARVVTRPPTGRSTSGRVYSGTWQVISEVNAKTLAEMFQRTLEAEVAGSWRSAGLTGNWWLRGARR